MNITTSFTDTTSSDATQSFFDTVLLIRGTYFLIHEIVATKKTLRQRQGKTMIWRRYEALSLATTALSEGTNPAGRAKTKTDVAGTIAPYGDFIRDSDMLISTQPDPQTTENVELLGQQRGESIDQLYRDVLHGGTNIVYANGTSVVTTTEIVDKNDLERTLRMVRSNKARPFTPMIMASQKIGTLPVMPAYWGLLDEDVLFDVRQIEGFQLVSDYSGNTGVLAAEVGAYRSGIRFLVSPNGYVTAGATGTTAAGTNVKNTASFVDVYESFVVGQQACAGVSLGDGNNRVIRKGVESGGTFDPLEMNATVGWKTYWVGKVLNANFMATLRSCASL